MVVFQERGKGTVARRVNGVQIFRSYYDRDILRRDGNSNHRRGHT